MNISKNDYVKNVFNLISRSFMLEIDGKKFQTMMPIADLFNFSPSRVNTEWKYNNETHNFEITASKDIKKGDEVKYLKINLDLRLVWRL